MPASDAPCTPPAAPAEPVRLYCPRCDGMRLCFPARTGWRRHAGHFALTVFTLGAWGVGWLACVVYDRVRPFRCNECGRRLRRGRAAVRLVDHAED